MKYLVDADVYAYKACLEAEIVTDWGNDLWTLCADLNEAFARMMGTLTGDIKQAGGKMKDAILCFSSHEGNWRKLENPDYKGNRKGKRKPLPYRPLVEKCIAEFPSEMRPLLEADDVMGIMGTEDPDTVIVSIDKDMKTLPANLFNPDKDAFPRRIEDSEAELFFWIQTLTGDPTDGYAGCPGIGPVSANNLLGDLDPFDSTGVWTRILEAYEKKDLGPDVATMNARMARICRAGDWDAERKEMVWMPPKV